MEEIVCIKCKIKQPLKEFKVRFDNTYNIERRRTDCRLCVNKRTRELWRKLRIEIFDHYGWECKCCGETIKEFLSLDHIDNDGYLDKNPNGDRKSGKELYLLVKKQGFPTKYQTLCMNCNWGKKIGNGICPHKKHG
jgi:hypothetical protein